MRPSSDLRRHAGKYYGKYAADVVGNEDPDNSGRIEVQIPPVFGEQLKVWARPCFPFGHFFVPNVGAKAWVEFEAGDPEFPLYVGFWYPNGTAPPETAVSPPTHRVMHTPSGHVIELSDEDGAEKIVIKHKLNSFISIDDKGSVLLANDKGSHLVLNSDDESASWMEQHGNLITMTQDGVAVVAHDGTTIEVAAGKVKILAADLVQIDTKDVVLNSASVGIGKSATESAVLGNQLATLWSMVVAHTHGTGVGPSGPPTPPIPPLAPGNGLSLSVKVK